MFKCTKFAALMLSAAIWVIVSVLLVPAAVVKERDQTDALPSWNDGPAKKAILDFVRVTTEEPSR